MKVSAIFLLAVAITTTTATAFLNDVGERSISGTKQVHKLLANAQRRQLSDGDAYDEEGITEVEEKLMDYSLKLLKCESAGHVNTYDDQGNLLYGVAIIRACPKNSCSTNTQGGCKSGHADFAVPLGDFVEAYLEDQADNLQLDDGVDIASYSQCAQYQPQGNTNNNNDGSVYYVGPACTSNGKDVMMGLFTDSSCLKTVSQSTSKGLTLPFGSGGLVSNQCLACGYKGDDGVTYLKDMCAGIYEDAALHCEEWDISHYYWDSMTEVYRFGKDTTGCKRIAWMDKTPEPFTEWASIFGLVFLVFGSVCGAVLYTRWWKSQKVNLEKIDEEEEVEGENPEDEGAEYHQHEGDGEHNDAEEDEHSNHSGLMGWFT